LPNLQWHVGNAHRRASTRIGDHHIIRLIEQCFDRGFIRHINLFAGHPAPAIGFRKRVHAPPGDGHVIPLIGVVLCNGAANA
jgi:hypothetical protein